MEATLLALEETRPLGYVSSVYLAGRIGWDPEGMPSPNGQGYGHVAVAGLLYRLYLAGRVVPAHQPNKRGHWGGWRISDSEHARRNGLEVTEVPLPPPLRLAATTLSGDVPLTEYPMPPSRGPMPPLPKAIRFPDGWERDLDQWSDILTFAVEWLDEQGILTPDSVPVKMYRGVGYLVNSQPLHSDGRPMFKRIQARGPHRFWVNVQASTSPGYYALYHVKRMLTLFQQDPASSFLIIPDDESAT